MAITNQIYVSGSSVLLARSDGKLLKGTKPIWDIEFNFNSEESVTDVNVLDPTKATWTPQGMSITGTRVRI